jgi:hypothetical protein
VLEAAVAPPPALIDLLRQHKAEVLAMLAATEYESNEHILAASERPIQAVSSPAKDEPSLEQPWAAWCGRVAEHGGALLHFCIECGRFGPYGYGVRLRAGQLGRWYCREHRPQEHDMARA